MINSNIYLPVITPDLVLVLPANSDWKVHSVSERLSTILGRSVSQLRGCPVSGVFPDAAPSLADLATEVVEGGQDLFAIRIRLVPQQADVLADIQLAGLTDDYQSRQVQVVLRSAGDVPEAEDFHQLVGTSVVMREVFRKIRLYAASDATVIITGETGARAAARRRGWKRCRGGSCQCLAGLTPIARPFRGVWFSGSPII